MKSTYLLLFIFISLFAFKEATAQNEMQSTYTFKVLEVKDNLNIARFKLTEKVNTEECATLEGLVKFALLNSTENYYEIVYKNEFSLDNFHQYLKKRNVDFDENFITIRNKSYYN